MNLPRFSSTGSKQLVLTCFQNKNNASDSGKGELVPLIPSRFLMSVSVWVSLTTKKHVLHMNGTDASREPTSKHEMLF